MLQRSSSKHFVTEKAKGIPGSMMVTKLGSETALQQAMTDGEIKMVMGKGTKERGTTPSRLSP